MWTYFQSSGILLKPDGDMQATGYSGHGVGVDNPTDQNIPDVGPIPQGLYLIGQEFTHPQCGPISMRLDPMDGTNTFGRSGFLMHGDTISLDHTASHGCIIMDRITRTVVSISSDRVLSVKE